MKSATILRWVAHIWGIASTLLLCAFAFGGHEHLRMTAWEALGFLFFPIGVVFGFFIAWKRELAGGLVTVISLALFHVWLGRFWAGPYFLLFAAPGFLHIASALIKSGEPEKGGELRAEG